MELNDPVALTTLLALIFGAAVLYSSVGHGGASGYLAAMALVGLSPLLMKPAAPGWCSCASRVPGISIGGCSCRLRSARSRSPLSAAPGR